METEKEFVDLINRYRSAVQFDKFRKAMMTAFTPKLVKHKLVYSFPKDHYISIQPMTTPAGMTRFLDYCFDENPK